MSERIEFSTEPAYDSDGEFLGHYVVTSGIESKQVAQRIAAAQSARIAELEGELLEQKRFHAEVMEKTKAMLLEQAAACRERIADMEKQVERVRVELKSWAMRLGYGDSDTHAFDYITFIHAKAANVSAERDKLRAAAECAEAWERDDGSFDWVDVLSRYGWEMDKICASKFIEQLRALALSPQPLKKGE